MVLYSKFKLLYNRIIILLYYHKLHRKNNESTQEWMCWAKNQGSGVSVQRIRHATDRAIH